MRRGPARCPWRASVPASRAHQSTNHADRRRAPAHRRSPSRAAAGDSRPRGESGVAQRGAAHAPRAGVRRRAQRGWRSTVGVERAVGMAGTDPRSRLVASRASGDGAGQARRTQDVAEGARSGASCARRGQAPRAARGDARPPGGRGRTRWVAGGSARRARRLTTGATRTSRRFTARLSFSVGEGRCSEGGLPAAQTLPPTSSLRERRERRRAGDFEPGRVQVEALQRDFTGVRPADGFAKRVSLSLWRFP